MNVNGKSSESGQSLVLIVALMLALVGMLAIGLDSGYVYVMRRAAQNAADAGALAGARALCDGVAGTDANTQANQYALTRNNVPGGVKTATVAVNGSVLEVKVTVNVHYNTLLGKANFINRNTNDVGATATAGCFAADTATGAMPVTKYCGYQPNADPTQSDCQDLQYSTLDDVCTYGTDKFYVFLNKSDSPPSQEPGDIIDETSVYWCSNWADPSPLPSSFRHVNCDFSGPGDGQQINMEPVMTSYPNHSWMWVDLCPNGGCSNTSDLKNIVLGNNQTSVHTHTWIGSASGGHTSTYDSIEVRKGDKLAIPIFDDSCNPGDPRVYCPAKTHAQDAYYIGSGGGSSVYFHLISFAVFQVTDVCKIGASCTNGGSNKARASMFHLSPSWGYDGTDTELNKVRGFEGCFVSGYLPGLSGISKTNTQTGADVVYLIK
jgi:hypothetical protein